MEGQTDKMDVDHSQEEDGEGNMEEREEKSERLKGEWWVSEVKCTPDNALSSSFFFLNTLFKFIFSETYLQLFFLLVLCISSRWFSCK